MRMISAIKNRWGMLMPLIPLIISRGKHSIISVFLNDKLSGSLGVTWILASKLSMGFKYVCKPLSSEGGFAVKRRNRWPQFWVNYNVFCV